MARMVRRVVTEQVGGRGKIVSDGAVPDVVDMGGGSAVVELWGDHGRAPQPSQKQEWSMTPPPGGSVCRIAEFAPAGPDEGPWMHITQTVDYGLVLEGEMVLVTDDGETVLHPGDVVIQRAANHGWHNRSGKLCRMLFILIDKPAP